MLCQGTDGGSKAYQSVLEGLQKQNVCVNRGFYARRKLPPTRRFVTGKNKRRPRRQNKANEHAAVSGTAASQAASTVAVGVSKCG